jgi:hypothetical protein
MSRRFAILMHTGHGPTHYDVLLECGEVLATWQCQADPTHLAALPLACRRIADHRTAYLDYEGPVSGGRGEVERIEAGTWEPVETGEDRWRFALHGQRMRGTFELRRTNAAAGQWQLRVDQSDG